MSDKKLLYWDWIKAEAKAIDSDGCSGVSDIYLNCCLEHDLGYWYGKIPASAYANYLQDVDEYWEGATITSRSEVDKTFRQCIQSRSKVGRWSPVSWVRWVGVRLFGKKIWGRYREDERNAS